MMNKKIIEKFEFYKDLDDVIHGGKDNTTAVSAVVKR